MKFLPLFLLLTLASLSACRNDKVKFEKLNLQSHGIPVVIMAPDSAVVQEKDYTFMRDITIRKDETYYIQIFEFDATNLDAAGEKLRQLTSVQSDPFFKELIKEDDQGFIYSRMLDSTRLNYDFRHVKILGAKELIFQTGLVGRFALEDVEQMYKSVSGK